MIKEGGLWVLQKSWETLPPVVELWGVFLGLKLASDWGFHQVELNIDSDAVFKCLVGKTDGNSQGRHLIRRIRCLLSLNWSVRIHHTYREASKVVDGLANLGCNLADDNLFEVFNSPSNALGVFTPRLIPI